MESTRTAPYNIDAEVYVLGSVFLDNTLMNGLMGKLNDEDFYDERHQFIYRAMEKLFRDHQKIEVITVIEELKRIKVEVNQDLKTYLLEIIDAVPSTATVSLYVEVVEEKAIERKLLRQMREISDDILASRLDFNALLDKAEDKVLAIVKKRRTSEFMTIEQASQLVFERIEKYVGNNSDLTGLDTGYPHLNQTTLGLQKGDLMILAARPSVGKSTYAINVALNVCLQNNAHVAFFSLEMSIEQLMMRIYSYQAEIELSKIRSGNLTAQELLLLGIAKQDLSKLHLYFDENISNNLVDIRAKCRQLKQSGKLDFIIIDYLQLITLGNNRGNRQEEVSQISRNLKTLARDLDVPILALSQLSRSIEGREDKRPVLADLRESGSIEQDADLVMFLYRRSDIEENDSELGEAEIKAKEEQKNEMLELILSVAKNRQGPLSHIDYHFFGHTCRFAEQEVSRPIIGKKKRRSLTKKLNANND